MKHVFQKNFSLGFGGLGNAVLSCFDVISVRSHRLTSFGEVRGLLEVHLKTPEGLLTTFCTHLGLDAKERIAQAGEIASTISGSQGIRVLCGDFNEGISGSAVSNIVTSTDLSDALPEGFLTYPSNAPAHRIDFVLCDPLVRVVNSRVMETNASDHLPVMVDMEIPDFQK